ncbi:MAG: TonB C-terminal domain-containing protein [Candidatus Omnitrophica bacterium]|nr:TonB C-terminal domain-containing protein [Candidatus Omnitrophota bacterium]
MFIEKELRLTLLFSLLLHASIFIYKPSASLVSTKDAPRSFEVRYIKRLTQHLNTAVVRHPGSYPAGVNRQSRFIRETFEDISRATIVAGVRPPPSFVRTQSSTLTRQVSTSTSQSLSSVKTPNQQIIFNKPAFIKSELTAIKKKITLPLLDSDKISNSSYIHYYQVIREKIKRAAYQNYTGSETGEVVVSFTVSQDGYIKDMRIKEGGTLSSINLRQIATKSINEAAPFPVFPKGLNYSQLTFNVVITFEIE